MSPKPGRKNRTRKIEKVQKKGNTRTKTKKTNKRKPQVVMCPYCGGRSEYTSSREVYHGKDYGMIYLCRPCEAYVGCHQGTAIPLGRLANAELRSAKMEAHRMFDPLWKDGDMNRHNAYAWLARELGLPTRYCHIGMFDVDQCQKVVEACVSLVNKKFRES